MTFTHSYRSCQAIIPKNSCQICCQIRAADKYKRHLRTHLKDGNLTKVDIEAISRFTRSSSQAKARCRKEGRCCPFTVDGVTCLRTVLNLGTHLIEAHSLDKADKL